MLELLVTPQFKKDLSKIPSQIVSQADILTSKLSENPLDPKLNITKLKGFKEPVWRVRLGNYRLVYTFNKTSLILLRIRHRKDVYRNI